MFEICSNNYSSKEYATAEEAVRDARAEARETAHYLRRQDWNHRRWFFRQERFDIAYDVCDDDNPDDIIDSFYPISLKVAARSMTVSDGHLYATGEDQFGHAYTLHATATSACEYEDGDRYSHLDWWLESAADQFGSDVTDLVVEINEEVI